MRQVCFLTTDDLTGYTSDDELAVEPLRSLGWQVSYESWKDPTVDWGRFEAVVIRTPWDYQKDAEGFLEVLRTIANSGARLENPYDIVEWNLNKRYLAEILAAGVPVIPTTFATGGLDASEFNDFKEIAGTDEIVVKPTISATAQDTFRVRSFDHDVARVFKDREFMIQPFIPSITEEGEYSLFFFEGAFSHAILKTPKTGDFRVQEEHGGNINATEPAGELMELGFQALSFIRKRLLYARIDAARGLSGRFEIMEVELIEPALYFRMDNGSAARFAEAFNSRMNEL
ncbi:MAG: hypothetical protein IPM21_10965 [Acidobacteria bacterium]|nr:hypothetical protein [Acidobacteriota bacterium]